LCKKFKDLLKPIYKTAFGWYNIKDNKGKIQKITDTGYFMDHSYTRELLDSVYSESDGLKAALDTNTDERVMRITSWLDTRMNLDLDTPVGTLDYTFDSLLPLWRWFYPAARFQTIAPKVLEGMSSTLKLCGRSDSDKLSPSISLLFTQETRMITFAIGHYVGKCFTDRSSAIKWGTHTVKGNTLKIKPVLKGFVIPEDSEDYGRIFAPFDEVTHTAELMLCGKYTVSGLYDLCMRWSGYIPEDSNDTAVN